MTSKDKILTAVSANQPPLKALPGIGFSKKDDPDLVRKFIDMLAAIGGKAIQIKSYNEIRAYIKSAVAVNGRVVSPLHELIGAVESVRDTTLLPHSFDNIELAIFGAHFGVAENGAVWLAEEQMIHRVIPFICQHLAVVIDAGQIVPTMHEAYDRLQDLDYDFGSFIAGPSKTADIEQSLVIGAHGPRSMTVFLMES